MYPEFFSEFQLCISFGEGKGEGELQENFKKDVLFYEATEEWQKYEYCIAAQGLLSRIVALKLC